MRKHFRLVAVLTVTVAAAAAAYVPAAAAGPRAPTAGVSWAGISDSSVTPPDPNGAIGPRSYIEIINDKIAIYKRTSALITSASLTALTAHGGLSDPMVLWDPNTQRFYYNVWDTDTATMEWGFSKTNNPTSIPGSFCNYTASFGYASSEAPDYPKLGQTKTFLMIGVNHYASFAASSSDRSDLLWISKPQGKAAISTCPSAGAFGTGRFTGLKNQNGTQAFTPVPAIQDDASSSGWIVTSSDIECPPTCGSGTLITVHTLKPSAANPQVPTLTVTGHSITVPSYSSPVTAIPQQGTTRTLDPLDGRLEHAVSAIDPTLGKNVVWTGHTVNSAGNRTEFRWYEILPTPLASPTVVRSGTVSSPSLYVFNGALAPDRTVNPTGAAHGDSIVIGFDTSSAATLPAVQMVSSVAGGAMSSFVLVHQAATSDGDFSCSPCRWGDYGGATSDPAASLAAATGAVWLTQDTVTSSLDTSWNWQATP